MLAYTETNDEKIFMMMVVAKNSIQITNDGLIRKFNFDDDAFNFVMISDKFQKNILGR